MEHRWQPPPLAGDKAKTVGPRLDEGVVRKMLQVNPALRQGRTTHQVKRALEAGEPVGAARVEPSPSTGAASSGELEATVSFFLGSKRQRVTEALAELERRRRALADEEARLLASAREEVRTFVGLLDAHLLRAGAAKIFAKHVDLLHRLGLSPESLLKCGGERSTP